MFFTTSARKSHLSALNDITSKSRSIISAKMKEVEEIDNQLKQVISETKRLTISIREKFDTQLKITKKSLKTLCQNLNDGVILVDCNGCIVEVNESCETIFGFSKEELVSKELSHLASLLQIKKSNGEPFDPSVNFFEALSHNIFYRLSQGDDVMDLETKLTITHPKNGEENFSFSFSVLDNDPEEFEDITYIVFFRKITRRD
jgi:PAS domain-containing protein